ncbi:9997_t:CDS:2, partial [Funneliformis geosporum]
MINFQAITLSPKEMEFFEYLTDKLFTGALPNFPNRYHWSILENYNNAVQVEKTELFDKLVNLEQTLGRKVNENLQFLQMAHYDKQELLSELKELRPNLAIKQQ